MSDYRRRITLTIDEDLIRALNDEAERDTCSVDELVERLLVRALDKIDANRSATADPWSLTRPTAESRRRDASSAAPKKRGRNR